MLDSDTGRLKLPVSLSEIQAPAVVAAARLRAQPLRPALLVGGVALAVALLVAVLGGSLVARPQALEGSLRLRRVGTASLRDPRTFGDISAGTAAGGSRPRLLLAPSVEVLQRVHS